MRWLFDPASQQGVAMRADWYVFVAAGIAVGLFVYASIFWCLIAYRRRTGREPAAFKNNPPLEITYAAIPFLLVLALFAVTFAIEMPIDEAAASPQQRISATAFRWSWQFDYGGGVVSSGTTMQPPALYLPLGRTTEIALRSADVTHSFWVPAFLFKRDAIPGMTNAFDVTPRHAGTYLSRCAQFCGLEHGLMTFYVKVVPAAAFDRYLSSGGTQKP